jgi:beta-galactosidase
MLIYAQCLLRSTNVRLETKLGIGGALLTVLMVGAAWYSTTTYGQAAISRLQVAGKAPKVFIKWNASTSPVLGYNVYRSTTRGRDYVKINPTLVRGLTYTDEAVESGRTYYYVARAVDAASRESVNSNESAATVP